MQNKTKVVMVCANCAASGIGQQCEVGGGCACCGQRADVVISSRTWSETKGHFIERAFAALDAAEAAKAPVEAVKVEAPAKVRCGHYKVIREFFQAAREAGFDTSKASQDRWRGAIGMLLGRRIESRAELSAQEWAFATNALRMGRLFI